VPSGFGHSIGHWEGDTLVVDTIGFAPRVCDSRRPVMLVPGGGRAKDTTHLWSDIGLRCGRTVGHLHLEDPTVFLAPHTYSYTYKRVPEGIPIENNEIRPPHSRTGHTRPRNRRNNGTDAATRLCVDDCDPGLVRRRRLRAEPHPGRSSRFVRLLELRFDSFNVPRRVDASGADGS
jgi:hypothetical protein